MELKEFQRLSTEIINKLDKKYNVNRTEQMNLSQLIEEFGELAKVVNLKNLRHKEPETKDLEDEFADVLLQLAKLADIFNIDLEKAILNKLEVLKKRHNLE